MGYELLLKAWELILSTLKILLPFLFDKNYEENGSYNPESFDFFSKEENSNVRHVKWEIQKHEDTENGEGFKLKDFLGLTFLLKQEDLEKIVGETSEQTDGKNYSDEQIIGILEKFYEFKSNQISIKRTNNLRSMLVSELQNNSMIIEIETTPNAQIIGTILFESGINARQLEVPDKTLNFCISS